MTGYGRGSPRGGHIKLSRLPKKVTAITDIMREKHARDITVLQLSRLSSFTNYFVICTAESLTQVRALADELHRRLPARRPRSREGSPRSAWVLLDYGDIIVHVFLPETRRWYDLERVWSDAPRRRLEEDGPPAEKGEGGAGGGT